MKQQKWKAFLAHFEDCLWMKPQDEILYQVPIMKGEQAYQWRKAFQGERGKSRSHSLKENYLLWNYWNRVQVKKIIRCTHLHRRENHLSVWVSCSFPWVAVQVFDVFFLCAYMVIGFDWIPKGLCFCQIYHVDPSSPAQHSSTVSHQYHNCTITASVPLLLHHFLSDQQL